LIFYFHFGPAGDAERGKAEAEHDERQDQEIQSDADEKGGGIPGGISQQVNAACFLCHVSGQAVAFFRTFLISKSIQARERARCDLRNPSLPHVASLSYRRRS
jgi:hypothetical protein